MPLPHKATRSLIPALAFLAALFAMPASAPAQDPIRTTVVELAPGLTYTSILDRTYPRRIHLLTLDPAASPAVLDVALARQRLPGFATVSTMASREGAVAAINGDFGLHPGRPAHGFADDGVLVQTPVVGISGKAFAVSADEQDQFLGAPMLAVRVHRYSKDTTWRVIRWNEGPPAPDQIVGFTPVGGSIELPPKRACSARFVPAGDPGFSADGLAVTQDFTVDAVECARAEMSLNGGVVLSSRRHGTGSTRVTNLDVGETASLSWSYGWRDVLDSIGGSPVVLESRVVQVSNCEEWLCGRAPRTAIGVTADGKVLLMVVDGRADRWSVGMTLKEEAVFLRSLGAVDAINLDGGGSSEMWINGEVVNRPSDGQERRVSSSVLILPGPDSLAPTSLVGTPGAPAMRTQEQIAADREAWEAARDDPASTGGLLELLP